MGREIVKEENLAGEFVNGNEERLKSYKDMASGVPPKSIITIVFVGYLINVQISCSSEGSYRWTWSEFRYLPVSPQITK